MKKVEIVFVALIFIGLCMTLLHWPYSKEILAIGSLLLSMLYFGFGFALLNNIRLRNIMKVESYKSVSKLRIFGAIVTGFAFSFLVIYILFKLMFWPYAQQGLKISLQMLTVIIATTLAFYLIKKRKRFLKLNYFRFFVLGAIGLALYLLTNNQLVDIYYGSDPEYAEEFKKYINSPNPDAERPIKVFNSKK